MIKLFSLVSSSVESEEFRGFRLFRAVLISSLISFVAGSLAMNIWVVHESPFLAQAIARFIVSGIFAYSVYEIYGDEENRRLTSGCILFFLFQMILDSVWTVAVVLQ